MEPIDQSLLSSERVFISDRFIEIEANKTPFLINLFLVTIAIVSFILPLASFSLLIYFKAGFHFGIVLGFAIFWALAFFIGRSLLWNIYGTEKIYQSDSELLYQPDFKYFKGNLQSLPLQHLDFEIHEIEPDKADAAIIRFTHGEQSIETSFRIPVSDCEIIIQIIENQKLKPT